MTWQRFKDYWLPWLLIVVLMCALYACLNDIILGLWYLSEPVSKVMP